MWVFILIVFFVCFIYLLIVLICELVCCLVLFLYLNEDFGIELVCLICWFYKDWNLDWFGGFGKEGRKEVRKERDFNWLFNSLRCGVRERERGIVYGIWYGFVWYEEFFCGLLVGGRVLVLMCLEGFGGLMVVIIGCICSEDW